MRVLCESTERKIGTSSLTAADRRNRCAGICILLCLVLYAFLMDPEKYTPFHCIFKELTGCNCLFCGMTHSLHAAAGFDWTAAAEHHLFGTILYLFMWILAACWTLELALNRKGLLRISGKTIKTVIGTTASVWLIYWLSNLSP